MSAKEDLKRLNAIGGPAAEEEAFRVKYAARTWREVHPSSDFDAPQVVADLIKRLDWPRLEPGHILQHPSGTRVWIAKADVPRYSWGSVRSAAQIKRDNVVALDNRDLDGIRAFRLEVRSLNGLTSFAVVVDQEGDVGFTGLADGHVKFGSEEALSEALQAIQV